MRKSKNILFQSITQSPLVSVWAIAVLLVINVRKALKKFTKATTKGHEKYQYYNAFGLTIGYVVPLKIYSMPDRILTIFTSFFAIISSVLFTSNLFGQYTFVAYTQEIMSVDDIGKYEHINIYVPDFFPTKIELK